MRLGLKFTGFRVTAYKAYDPALELCKLYTVLGGSEVRRPTSGSWFRVVWYTGVPRRTVKTLKSPGQVQA